jgi:hypothetical protein
MNELVDGLKTVHHVYSPEITILGPTTTTGIWAVTDWFRCPRVCSGAGATTTRSTRRSTASGRSERPTALGFVPRRAVPSHRIIPLTVGPPRRTSSRGVGPFHPPAIRGQEDRSFAAFADGQVGPSGTGASGDGDDRAVIAPDVRGHGRSSRPGEAARLAGPVPPATMSRRASAEVTRTPLDSSFGSLDWIRVRRIGLSSGRVGHGEPKSLPFVPFLSIASPPVEPADFGGGVAGDAGHGCGRLRGLATPVVRVILFHWSRATVVLDR